MGKVPKISLSVAVAIEDPYGQQLLLAQRNDPNEAWGLGASGNVEPGEGFLDAAYRETTEELKGMKVVIRGVLRAPVTFSDDGEKISIGVVFLGIFLPSDNDKFHELLSSDPNLDPYDSSDFRFENLSDTDTHELGFFGRSWIRGLIDHPERVFMPEKNLETLARWVGGYTLPVISQDVWRRAFIEPTISRD